MSQGEADGHRERCTTAFVVTDGARTGVATAAHCPDELVYRDQDGSDVALAFAGQWGLAYQDVQINLSPDAAEPLFYANRGAGFASPAGDLAQSRQHACRRLRLPLWRKLGLQLRRGRADRLCAAGRAVRRPVRADLGDGEGPQCIPGDSGGPVFSGEVAFGIAKGINRSPRGRLQLLLLHVDRLLAAAVAAADRR